MTESSSQMPVSSPSEQTEFPSSASEPSASPAAVDRPPLSAIESRVLGVLIEKQKTTPDIYPLSVNAIVTGSNQKSNREPLMNIDDVTVEDTLAALQSKGLVSKIEGGRVEKWRHHGYERWSVSKEGIAILAELFLRGPQTEGELRSRASRMEPINDREALKTVLAPLLERGLIVWLSPEGRRGSQLSHGFLDSEQLERLRANQGRTHDAVSESGGSSSAARLAQLEADVAELKSQVAELRSRLG
jgi:uncharacterized protein YceH (UPF0502 family)